MSIFYLVTLIGVGAMLLLMVIDAMRRVSRRPDWRIADRPLRMGQQADRRLQGLPFVGRDRRRPVERAQVRPAADHRDAA